MKEIPHLLVIEDDPSFRRLVSTALVYHGYAVNPVPNGEEGLERIRTFKHDAVITDFRMRGLSGLELVQKLHEEKPDLPIIIMTGYGKSEEILEATKEGAEAYLLKPFVIYELLLMVEKALMKKSSS